MFLTFLTGPFGKYAIYAAFVAFLLASAFGYIKLKEHQAAQAALASFNQQQYEQVQKDNAAYKAKIADLQKIATDLQAKNNALNAVVDVTAVETVKFIDNTKTSKIYKLDPLFNQVLNRLKGSTK